MTVPLGLKRALIWLHYFVKEFLQHDQMQNFSHFRALIRVSRDRMVQAYYQYENKGFLKISLGIHKPLYERKKGLFTSHSHVNLFYYFITDVKFLVLSIEAQILMCRNSKPLELESSRRLFCPWAGLSSCDADRVCMNICRKLLHIAVTD